MCPYYYNEKPPKKYGPPIPMCKVDGDMLSEQTIAQCCQNNCTSCCKYKKPHAQTSNNKSSSSGIGGIVCIIIIVVIVTKVLGLW
jgi:hypothetical protein